MTADNVRSIWTVYDHPRDRPDVAYLARRWEVHAGTMRPTDDVLVGGGLDAVRAQLPLGLFCIDRAPSDDGVIVESWI